MFLLCNARVSEWIDTLCCLNVKELLAQNRWDIWSLNDCNRIWIHNHLLRKRTLNHLANWPNGWAELGVLICTVHSIVCSYHVTYMFHTESTLYFCLNVKERFAGNRHDLWSLCDCNRTRTYNHLARKGTLNHLAQLTKWLSWILSTYLYGAVDCMFLSCHARVSEWIHTS